LLSMVVTALSSMALMILTDSGEAVSEVGDIRDSRQNNIPPREASSMDIIL
jgi:hypothetical protein